MRITWVRRLHAVSRAFSWGEFFVGQGSVASWLALLVCLQPDQKHPVGEGGGVGVGSPGPAHAWDLKQSSLKGRGRGWLSLVDGNAILPRTVQLRQSAAA